MNNVKNNHDAPLAIAGVTINAGATVGIDSDALRASLNSNGVKQWIKIGLIEVEDLDKLTEAACVPVASAMPTLPSGVKGDEKTPERLTLEARATKFEISFRDNTKDETLVKKIAEAEEALTNPK